MTEKSFEDLAHELDRLFSITDQWSPEQRATVEAIRGTLEALQAGAFRSLIRSVREDPGGLAKLKEAVQDPWVMAVLTHHGLLKPPEPSLEDRVEAALGSVRPMLKGHAGDVELIEIPSEREVHIRLIGSCDGCAHSDVTVRMGIETAIKEAVPTVETIKVVNKTSGQTLVQLPGVDASPFSRPWQDAGLFIDMKEDDVRSVELENASILIARAGGEIRAYPNACTHLGMPLDTGTVRNGVLTCIYHGFQFALASGECLTAPDVQLPRYPVKVENGRLYIQVTR